MTTWNDEFLHSYLAGKISSEHSFVAIKMFSRARVYTYVWQSDIKMKNVRSRIKSSEESEFLLGDCCRIHFPNMVITKRELNELVLLELLFTSPHSILLL